ncbi:MAG: efflux RND transporter periplasmic adaptor subunit [Elusimicrobiota bacterium]|nr:efflux RND transporter periplasmic adaptor subunit [Elusimicrobiota bacterium]
MKKIIILIVVLILAGSGIYYYKFKKKNEGIKYIQTEAISKNMSEIIDTSGEVEPLNRVEINPSSPGRVEEILIREGDKISAGQTLALMSSQDRVAIMDAARSMDEKEYEYWKNAYKSIKVISPLDGTIILKNVVRGQTVGSGTVLFAVSDKLIISGNVDESDIGRVKVGQRAEIILDAYPRKTVKGRVSQILDEGKNVSNVIIYKVKIMPYRLPKFFKSQMTANIKIYLAKRKNAIVVPSQAITIDEDGEGAVITEFKDKKPVYTKVKTGKILEGKTEIVSGVKNGDAVWYEDIKYAPQKSAADKKNMLMPKRPGRKKKKTGVKKALK